MQGLKRENPRLREYQVRERVSLCQDDKVLGDLYVFGTELNKDVLDRVKALETKATSFAAYGAAIVSLLIATAGSWMLHGNLSSLCIAFSAAICGLLCNVQAVRALLLEKVDTISQDEWLNQECLNDLDLLRRFRIVTLWGVIESRSLAQDKKSYRIRQAEVWLASAVAFLVLLLLQVALYSNLKGYVAWVVLSPRTVWIAFWYLFVGTGWGFGATCGLGLWVAWRFSRRII